MFMNRRFRSSSRLLLLGCVSSMVLSLSACGGGGSDDSAAVGTSVPVGATKEQYVAALADMEPVTLTVQLTTGPDSTYSVAPTSYAKAVEEWSGGKIKFEILYSGSRVQIREMNQALNEGLVDMGQHIPAFDPDAYPVNTYASDLLYLHDSTPVVGSLQLAGAWTEFSVKEKTVREELIQRGIQPLLPVLPSGSAILMCKGDPVRSLAEAKGKQVRMSSRIHADQLEALGATPVDVPTNEIYQALQRGVVQCAASALAVAETQGLAEVTDNWTIDSQVQFSGTQAGFGMSAKVWNDLPLPARQLLWDRLDVYIKNHVEHTMFNTYRSALETAQKHNIKLHDWDDDARGVLKSHFDKTLQEAPEKAPQGLDGAAFLQTAVDNHERWKKVVTEDLGVKDDISWAELPQYIADGKLDLSAFTDRIVKDILQPNRPS